MYIYIYTKIILFRELKGVIFKKLFDLLHSQFEFESCKMKKYFYHLAIQMNLSFGCLVKRENNFFFFEIKNSPQKKLSISKHLEINE